MEKTRNGNLKILAFNGLVTLHVGSLLRPEDIGAVKEASKMLPMTLAAFAGADGRSVEVIVAVAPQVAILQPAADAAPGAAGAGLNAMGVAPFGRYLKSVPRLRQKRVTKGMLYLVRKKK